MADSSPLFRELFSPPECMDEKHNVLVDSLLSYANEKVTSNWTVIAENLRKHGLLALATSTTQSTKQPQEELNVDLLWPGSAYWSIACGGQMQVLLELEKKVHSENREILEDIFNKGPGPEKTTSTKTIEIIFRPDRICGASGGACSALLCAPGWRDTRFLLNAYLAYARHQEKYGLLKSEWYAVTPFWREAYLEAARIAPNTKDLFQKRFIAVRQKADSVWDTPTRKLSNNVVFHNFETSEELASAGVASGEATLMGLWSGVEISASKLPTQRFMDGGKATHMNCLDGEEASGASQKRPRPFLTYSTYFVEKKSYALYVTPDSVSWLFKRGVDDTLDWLLSENLETERMHMYRADLWTEETLSSTSMTRSDVDAHIRHVNESSKKKLNWGTDSLWDFTQPFGFGSNANFVNLGALSRRTS
ncbi:unnamed protein product [Amoebophrya sp. A25]|nr:unnamed protein product [Amoebophrya sp. A25]|eukprot:GSA25T00012063001.1